ncbi:acyl-CoA carboxylase subunit epsilon [Amycolatopsis pithecellobii]|uniref:Acyl-CoA carboxylase subunit epsilon n=1 Tax=Amycolatopsis pithecellobii TaxID=664692 RepID=A0A6N7Z3D0_9PSEU|nr:acyl-CoA carboxylase subunit epsilon [Amycolatopsis pithecellobii]MTD54524.1 acyl-CoA carboxylase subunit epsilon [Amycolatopsis pithecellobii]
MTTTHTEAVIRVVRGRPDPVELAALVVVLTGRAGRPAPLDRAPATWRRPEPATAQWGPRSWRITDRSRGVARIAV